MAEARWSTIEFKAWVRGRVAVWTNRYSQEPVVLKVEGYEGSLDADEWMTPTAARELAAKLIEAADAADRAGLLITQ